MKDASEYIDPFVTVSVVNMAGQLFEANQARGVLRTSTRSTLK